MAFTRFTDLSGPSVIDLSAGTVAVLPVGAIEQHGPHLPVATDYFMAEAIAEGAALAASDSCDITLLPGLAYTKSDEHAWSPGTLWLSASTLLAVLDDLGRSLAMGPSGGSRSSTRTAVTVRCWESLCANCAPDMVCSPSCCTPRSLRTRAARPRPASWVWGCTAG